MPKRRTVTKDGRCPYCNADFTDTSIDGTSLFWESRSWGNGYIEVDEETGDPCYNGTSSPVQETVTNMECGACGEKLRLRAGTEEAWS
jgi:hypothetical protein